jgi:hypothetical protein
MHEAGNVHIAAVLVAASMAAFNNSLLAAEPAAKSLTAIDVLLLPDETMINRATAANARLRKDYPQGFALDAVHRTHITLLQRYVRTKDLDAVYAAVEHVFNHQRPVGWELKAFSYYHLDFNGMGLAGIVIQPTPRILQLQQALIEAVAPYAESGGAAAAYATTPEHPDVNAPTIEYVESFVPKRTGKNYNPHVTIGVGHLDFVKEIEAAPFESFKFKVTGAAVFQLGNFGTASKQLWAWKKQGQKPVP